MNVLNFTNDLGIPMIARFVRKGDRYGLDGCLTHDEDNPLIEFYDARYDHNVLPQYLGGEQRLS